MTEEQKAAREAIWQRIAAISLMPFVQRTDAMAELYPDAKVAGISRKEADTALKQFINVGNAKAQEAGASATQAAIDQFNARFFMLTTKSKVRVAELTRKEVNGHAYVDIAAWPMPEFRIKTANEQIDGKLIADLWVASPDRRDVNGTIMDPSKPPNAIIDGRMNIWQGFGVEPAPGDHMWFVNHVFRLFDDKAAASYTIYWLALAFQKPQYPIGTAIIVIGEQGTGKGMLGNTVRSIFGPHGIMVENRDGLIGRFNSHLRNACFVFVDEPPFAGSRADADRLKHLITDPTITVEAKYRDSEEVDNRLKIMAATNHEWAANIDAGDRRFAIFEASKDLLHDDAYFTAFKAKMDDPVAKAAVLDYLLNLDVKGFSPERDRPFTEIATRQKFASLQHDDLFWRAVCERGTFAVAKGLTKYAAIEIPKGDATMRTSKADIYNCYCEWHSIEVGRGGPVNATWFWRHFYAWSECESGIGQYGDPMRMFIVLPALEILLQRFEKSMTRRPEKSGTAKNSPNYGDVPF